MTGWPDASKGRAKPDIADHPGYTSARGWSPDSVPRWGGTMAMVGVSSTSKSAEAASMAAPITGSNRSMRRWA